MRDANVYLAAERTFLAWIRTGLALMGFGFVVARFGLFLQELQISQLHLKPQSYGLSQWFGAALIMLGVIVSLLSLWRHLRLVKEWNRGEVAFRRASYLTTVVALLLAAIGLAMAIYLASTHTPHHANREGLPESAMTPNPNHGIVSQTSQHSVGRSRLALCEGSTPIRVLNARHVFAEAVAAGAGEAGDLAAAGAIISMLSWPSWPASMMTRKAEIWEESFEARSSSSATCRHSLKRRW